MNEQSITLLKSAEKRADELFQIACDIFDHPELGRREFYACSVLEEYLRNRGFVIEHGLADLDTSFKASFQQGTGGPTIGFVVEYDALKEVNHACGHHLQGPAGIGAALSILDVYHGPVKLVIYGTPDEEGSGGKIDMATAGVFNDADLIFAYHTGESTGIVWENLALQGYNITFHGQKAHAAGAPYKGRSALDAAVLMFHALEIMREHCTEGTRIHYNISEGTGPSNVVPDICKVVVTLRNTNSNYLADMKKRFADIISGACLMTGTTADVTMKRQYDSLLGLNTPCSTIFGIMKEIKCENIDFTPIIGRGSTDVGNVSWAAPTIYFQTYFTDVPPHTDEYAGKGKLPCARDSMLKGSQIAGLFALRCLNEPEYLALIKAEFEKRKVE